MPTSQNAADSPAPSAPRDLRDSWIFRIVAIAVVLGAAVLLSHGCASSGRDIKQDEAVVLAKKEASFKPDRYQVRFLQRGVPPHPYWGVSLYDLGPNGMPSRVELYLVDATTGVVTLAG